MNKNKFILNLLFAVTCVGILLFLLRAPEKSTTTLPHDANHQRFYEMGKKEAEKYCIQCHKPDGVRPLPKDHPPKYRCLFCHTKE